MPSPLRRDGRGIVLPDDKPPDRRDPAASGLGGGFLPGFGSQGAEGIERMRLAMRNLGLAFFETDLLRGQVIATPNAYAMFGLAIPPFGRAHRDVFWDCYHPDDLHWAKARHAADLRRETDRDTYCERARIIHRQSRQTRWIEFTGHIFGQPEARTHIVGLLRDVTDLVEAEERERLLAVEVNHRANNVLAVTQALVAMTRADEVASYRTALQARILTLARTYDLLARTAWQTDLHAVVVNETAAFADRVVIGPAAVFLLQPSMAQAVAMLLHELVMNAVKHGGLSTAEGNVDVSIAVRQETVVLVWREAGGPLLVGSPARSGTGTVLMQRLARQVRAELALDWRPEGLVAELRLPMASCRG